MNTKKIVTVGIFSALAFAVMFIEFPIFPAASFLKYDPSEVFALLSGLGLGLGAGILVVIVKDILFYFAKSGDIIGIVMNIAAGISFLIPVIYFWKRSKILSGVLAVLIVTAIMVVLNAVVVPFYFKAPFSLFLKFLPWIVLFNIVKFSINFLLTVIIYRYVERIFRLV